MSVLIDTHVFLWMDSGRVDRVPLQVRRRIELSGSDSLLSLASAWEIGIKQGIGKLRLDGQIDEILQLYLTTRRLSLLPISLGHIKTVARLPHHHRDPFDRLIIAQALCERLPVISADPVFSDYGVERLWD